MPTPVVGKMEENGVTQAIITTDLYCYNSEFASAPRGIDAAARSYDLSDVSDSVTLLRDVGVKGSFTTHNTKLNLSWRIWKQFYKIRTLRNSRDDCFVSNTTDAKANAHNCYGFCDGHQRMMPTLSCLNSAFIIIVDF
ncbi:hypothetical protein BLNAU_19988 [Blattamonas nauphoetae]|uniref:Uncharacterized protein n=1 Tax=Blattamonas nauphoetae TaxID=2049346 RepID=A0ABQ9X040_9EUKA|nr:hypothetical protein BLNAU_19988 [Blattamonas nauphoetae]